MLDRAQPLALAVLRVVLGVILIAHGKGKVFGGLAAHQHTVVNIGFPSWMAYLSAGTEFFGGILLIAGLLTRLVGVAVTIQMLVIVFRVHWKGGLTGPGGYEFPLLIGTSAFALIFFGAGPISLDWLIGGGRQK
ncbi:MAG: DoxX family protein [Terriglobales bacterium]